MSETMALPATLRTAPSEFSRSLSYLLDRPLFPPEKLIILVTHRCPMSCVMCNTHDWLAPGYREMTFEEVSSLITQASLMGVKEVMFSGGEPLLRAEECVRWASLSSEKGMRASLITSGFAGEEYIAGLIDAGVTTIMVSIDGHDRETFESVRGVDGGFERLCSFLERLDRERGKAGRSREVTFSACTVIQKSNYGHIRKIRDFAGNAGLNGILFQALAPDKNFYELKIPEDGIGILKEEIGKINVSRNDSPRVLNGEDYLGMTVEYYKGSLNSQRRRCMAGYGTLVIAPDGSVSSCMESITRKILGKDQTPLSLPEIWNHPLLGEVRHRMRTCKTPCLICCWYE